MKQIETLSKQSKKTEKKNNHVEIIPSTNREISNIKTSHLTWNNLCISFFLSHVCHREECTLYRQASIRRVNSIHTEKDVVWALIYFCINCPAAEPVCVSCCVCTSWLWGTRNAARICFKKSNMEMRNEDFMQGFKATRILTLAS